MNQKKNRVAMAAKVLLALSVLGGGMLADSNLRLVTTEYTLAFPHLPEGFDGFRIVQLSDLHGASFGKDNARLLRAVRKAGPDLIALTGDLADALTDYAVIDALLANLVEIAPVYFVSGNHEWNAGAISALEAMFRRYGVRYLRNEGERLLRGGSELVLAGVEDPNGWADQPTPTQVAEALPAQSFRVLLGHRNYWVERYPDLPVDLILCGHAHGGIVRVPGVGGLVGHARDGTLLPDYTAGVYRSGRYRMVVSRGLGNRLPLLRFCNNPEIVVVVLRRGGSNLI